MGLFFKDLKTHFSDHYGTKIQKSCFFFVHLTFTNILSQVKTSNILLFKY